MGTGAAILSLNFLMIQNIPAPAWLALNIGLLVGVWVLLKKQRVDKESTRINNHILLLLGTWCAISICMGLLLAFDLLGQSTTAKLFDGFLYGFRIAMIWIFCGVIVMSAPVILYFRYGPSSDKGKVTLR